MFSWWNSIDTVSVLSTGAQWVVAVAGIAALVFGLRASALKDRADVAERARVAADLQQARSRADESLAQQQPRRITAQQRELFLLAATDKPKGPKTLIPLMGNVESERLAKQLAALIVEAGYTVEMSGMLPMDNTPTGVGLTVKRGENYPPHTDGLQAAFNRAGIPVGRGFNGLQNDNILGLVVGSKP
jgi:hypothetical protein